MDKFNLFVPIKKYNAKTGEIEGVLALEELDKSAEIFDYDTSKPYFQKWTENFQKLTDGKSAGNMRAMHQPISAGKFTLVSCDDASKSILVKGVVVDPVEKAKAETGVYTGFSLGGKYVKKWADDKVAGATRYTADPGEGSLVDNPCMYGATFSFVKVDGAEELRKFQTEDERKNRPSNVDDDVAQRWMAHDGSDHSTKAEAIAKNVELRKTAETSTVTEGEATTDTVIVEAKDGETAEDILKRLKTAVEKAEQPAADTVTPEQVQKSLYAVSDLASCLQSMLWMRDDFKWEAIREGDSAVFSTSFNAWVGQGITLLSDYLAEQAKEYANAGDDVVEMAVNIEMTKREALGKIEGFADLVAKAGARNSTADQKRIQTVHDHAVELGAECKAGDAEKIDGADDVAKVTTLNEESITKAVIAAVEKITGERDALQKRFDEFVVSTGDLVKRMEAIEALPRTGGPSRIVLKHQDGLQRGNETTESDDPFDQLMAKIEKMPEDQRAHELMKLSLRFPRQIMTPADKIG